MLSIQAMGPREKAQVEVVFLELLPWNQEVQIWQCSCLLQQVLHGQCHPHLTDEKTDS